MNVKDSDSTLILTWGRPQGGTLLTIEFAQKLHKPYLVINMNEKPNCVSVIAWIKKERINILNIAGPRQSFAPFVYDEAYTFLKNVLVL